MSEFIGRLLGVVFNMTGNLGLTIAIAALAVFVINRILILIRGVFDKKNTSLSVSYKSKGSFRDKKFDLKTNTSTIVYYAVSIIGFIISIAVLIVFTDVVRYIPGVYKNGIYPFLFIGNILENNLKTYIPIICVLFMFVLNNICDLKTLKDSFSKKMFRLAFDIVFISFYTLMFGPAYLIYKTTLSTILSTYRIIKTMIIKAAAV